MSPGTDPVPILVVEDNQRYAELIERMLGTDFAPERAATLGDAVAAIQQGGRYSCILLDLLLPGTDRLEAVDAIRVVAPECPIVVLTGVDHGGIAVEAMQAGVQDYLYKGDIEPEILRRSVLYAMERKRAQLAHEALHDPLTGLPNRTLFRDRCLQALSGIGRTTSGIGVLFVDLDGFKQVNDSLGHARGDHLLVEVADRLRHAMRAGDTVSRFGGDEFTVLGATLDSRHDATRLAQRITQALNAPFAIGERAVSLTCSIGIAFTFERDSDPDRLIHDADLAMYRAKERGGACYEVFGQSLRARTAQRRELEAELRAAIEGRQLRVAYQPQVEMATGRHDRPRGARPMAASRARPRRGRRVHPHRGGHGDDPRPRALGPGGGVPRLRELARGGGARRRRRDRGEPVAAAAGAGRHRGRDRRRRSPRPESTPAGSASR